VKKSEKEYRKKKMEKNLYFFLDVHVLLDVILVFDIIILDGGILVLLVLGNQIVHVGF
jgi:hypothetical protein